ncbi:MAG TPA: putative lipid II flippase FtsW [Candidatus Paceibacterota bacterium]|nr:putative lipid II flippase FtsW [Candidatus Paceibacterota bacterium]
MQRRLFWIIVVLLVFGLVMLYSASSVQGQQKFGSPSYFVVHQLLYGVLPGVAAMLLASRVDYRHLRPFALPILAGAFVLMVLLFVPDFGIRLKGATSWLSVMGIAFQPSEFLKLALVIYLSAWFGAGTDRVKNWQFGLLPFGLIVGFSAMLLIRQPDFGTLGIVLAIALGMFFLAGSSIKQTAVLGLVGVVALGAFVATSPERLERVRTLVDPEYNPRGASWQLNQALIAIGAGGLWGVGYGQSTQKLGFLPETIADSIYAVIAEELGFAGAVFTLLLFAALGYQLVRISMRAPDAFGQLLAGGMAIWILTQAAVNMAAITGLMPLTGLPLPFISYGGTSMVSVLAGLGIVLNVAKRAKGGRRSSGSSSSILGSARRLRG